MQVDWRQLAEWQCGLVSRRQLNASGIGRNRVRNQVAGGRWMTVGPMVVATFTGDLTFEQRAWAGHLHAGPSSAVSGFASARLQGLTGWHRPTVEVMVPARANVADLEGVTFLRSRRDLGVLRGQGVRSHLVQLEPSVLLRASSGIPERVAGGLVASAVQQRLTSANRLLAWLDRLRPLSRSSFLRSLLHDIRGGAESMAEIDHAEWDLPDGSTLVLEVDGAFHMEVQHWVADLRRQRKIASRGRVVVRGPTGRSPTARIGSRHD